MRMKHLSLVGGEVRGLGGTGLSSWLVCEMLTYHLPSCCSHVVSLCQPLLVLGICSILAVHGTVNHTPSGAGLNDLLTQCVCVYLK